MTKTVFFLALFCNCMLFAFNSNAQGNIMVTFAGDSTGGYSGDNGPATNAQLMTPSGVATDRHGNVFIIDQNNNRCRKVDAAGIITTVAGNGTYGYSGDSSLATNAQLAYPTGLAVDRKGNLFIADQFNNVVRKVDTAGIITTIAGNGTTGYSGDSGIATMAELWHPADVGVDSIGNVFIADQDNNRIRKVDTMGIITTVAGTGISGFSVDSGVATNAQLNFPQGITVDKHGNVIIADFYNSRIRKVDMAGTITTIAGNGVGGYSGDDSMATAAAIYYASAVAVDDTGNVYISDYYNNRIRKVNTAGIITTIAGSGVSGYSGDNGPATAGAMSHPQGVAVDTSGNVYIADFNNARVREVKNALPVSTGMVSIPTISVFPNPSTGKFTIRLTDGQKQQEVNIYNLTGEQVYRSGYSSSQAVIDLSGLPPNIYILYVRSGATTIIEKLMLCCLN